MVRMATANGPATATDVVDIDVPGLEAHARVLLLKGCPAVLSLGRLVEDHKCSFLWNSDGAVLIDSSGNRHECVVRNYVPFSGTNMRSRCVMKAPRICLMRSCRKVMMSWTRTVQA